MNFSNNEWYRLASSDNESDWTTALDLASEFKEKLQMELLYWFGSNIGFHWRFKIYDLLDDDNKKLALQLISDNNSLSSFDRIKAFDKFKETKDNTIQSVITYLDRWHKKPVPNFKRNLILEYKNRKKCSVDEAKLIINRLFVEEPGNAADQFSGEIRSDKYEF